MTSENTHKAKPRPTPNQADSWESTMIVQNTPPAKPNQTEAKPSRFIGKHDDLIKHTTSQTRPNHAGSLENAMNLQNTPPAKPSQTKAKPSRMMKNLVQ